MSTKMRTLARVALGSTAAPVTDAELLSRLIAAGQAKYGAPFHARWAAALTQYFRLDPIR